MPNWGIRRAAAVLFVLYVGAGLAVVLWPTPVDRDMHGDLMNALASIHSAGFPTWINYNFVESAANVVMFGPLGILLPLMLSRGLWWVAPVAGVIASVGIETAQFFFLPERVATMHDVLTNSSGAIIGTAIILLVRAAIAGTRVIWPRLATSTVLTTTAHELAA